MLRAGDVGQRCLEQVSKAWVMTTGCVGKPICGVVLFPVQQRFCVFVAYKCSSKIPCREFCVCHRLLFLSAAKQIGGEPASDGDPEFSECFVGFHLSPLI